MNPNPSLPLTRIAGTCLAAAKASGHDPVHLLLELARQAKVGIAYEIRETVDDDGLLSDEQWAKAAPYLEDFDEWLADSDLVGEFRRYVFSKAEPTCSAGRPIDRYLGCGCEH